MQEPWDKPDWQTWRVWADYLMETQAPAAQIKRAVKYALGLQQRPKLVMVAQTSGDTTGSDGEPVHAGARCGVLAGATNWSTWGLTNHRWVSPSWYVGEMTRLYGPHRAHNSLNRTVATPADFPGMLEAESGSLGFVLTRQFYVKVSELIAVRCRQGRITIRRGRSAKMPWTDWKGV